MRTLAFLLVSTAVAYCLEPLSSAQLQQWAEYKLEYGKMYKSLVEEELRRQIFFETLDMIEEHNKKYEAGLVTYTKGINQFTDMTQEEFKKTLLPFNLLDISMNLTMYSPPPGYKAADQIDWRQHGAVTSVKNQKLCGSCWAFSTTGVLEGQLKIKTGKLVALSEQELVDCDTGNGNDGCNGGLPERAFQYIIRNDGINSEASYPYKGVKGKCVADPKNNVGTATGVKRVPPDEKALQSTVSKIGPVSVGINGGAIKDYKGGIIQDNCPANPITHAVLVVGYGSERGVDYWIVKNSYGQQWGERGYLRVARHKNNVCGITSIATYPEV